MTGRFTIVGIGPGDPELLTIKAARVIGEAAVVAYHAGVGRSSHARRIAAAYFPADVIEEELRYPVTTGTTDHPGGYVGAMADFYESCAARLAAHLGADRDVVLLAEGDPLFYGSSMYLHDRFKDVYDTSVVPGVPAFSAATAAVSTPLVRQTDVLTVLPGTLPEPELARRLADTDAAVIMKLGRLFPRVRSALAQAGRLDGAWYVERASQAEERWLPVADVDPDSVPYFSLIVVPGDTATGSSMTRMRSVPAPPTDAIVNGAPAELLVVGLGPGRDEWLTPEATEALAGVDHVVGYGPYVGRVPQRAGLTRHASGNTVELDRARAALDLARAGERVAVVSGGDAGVFGMAAAVFEAAEAYPDVAVRVLPGVSAVQAVAARAGAPIGADFAVVSLSDRLKPWALIERRLRAVAEADLVLAIYNPASRSRMQQVAVARNVLLEHRKPDTVVVVGRDVGRAEESLTITTLAELDPATIDMKCLLIVGASSTRVAGGRVWTPRSTDEAPR
ncbi:precorrin-3B C(17)-methyltransferase [Nocardioides terrisoli]|uniref:precorrin-3B C(17)-methyltransferase n=1 Tax=Nocardioides terrisoli TaxID=3388267 RepID=UPI00287BC365|nr:precorrin-3B C(17)-methyltransferase [Nocardioides marmorisolisilvae]